MGIGTVDNPWTLNQALNSLRLVAGDEVYLRGGVYPGDFVCNVSGLSSRPITFKNYPGERPIIDGSLTISGDYIWWMGIEHKNSSFTDRSGNNGGDGIVLSGDYCKVVNCTIHDFGQGFKSGGSAGVGGEIYGCLFYHNGWNSNLGHGLYPQNNGPVPKVFKDNLVFDNFGYGFHLYGSGGQVNNMHLFGNTIFNNGSPRGIASRNILYDTSETITNPVLSENMTYRGVGAAGNFIGDPDNPTVEIEIYGNYMMEAAGARPVLIRGSEIDINRLDGNTFIGRLDDLGFDQGAWSDNVFLAEPSGQQVFLKLNDYNDSRANITIYNWDLANSVTVDVSSVLSPGDSYRLRNVQDYFTDIQTGTVAQDGTISVDMQAANRTVAAPAGWDAPPTTFPQFGAFVLELA